MIAHTKQQLQSLESEAVRIEYSEQVYNLIFDFHHDIGASGLLPDNQNDIKDHITDWHEKFIESPVFPDAVPFDKVYSKFFKASVTGVASRKGNNIAAMIESFNHWFRTAGGKYSVFPDYYQISNPAPEPQNKTQPSRKISEWSDEEINDSYQGLKNIYGTDLEKVILRVGGRSQGKSFFARIQNEYIKRGLDKAKT